MKNYHILKSAKAFDDYKLELIFDENEKRIYDFSPNLSHKYYSELKEVSLFKAVRVNDGEIEWATGQDFCPNTLYEDSLELI